MSNLLTLYNLLYVENKSESYKKNGFIFPCNYLTCSILLHVSRYPKTIKPRSKIITLIIITIEKVRETIWEHLSKILFPGPIWSLWIYTHLWSYTITLSPIDREVFHRSLHLHIDENKTVIWREHETFY